MDKVLGITFAIIFLPLVTAVVVLLALNVIKELYREFKE